ncbi:hypothetical protein ACFV6U_34595 [Streptomyces sp. NPDC059810]
MTIRVSHDGGRTYGEPIAVESGDLLSPVATSVWPPCDCPQHRVAPGTTD